MKTDYILDHTSLKSSQDEKFLRQKLQKIKTHISCAIFFFKSCRLWRNNEQQSRPQITIWGMRNACWIPKATNTLSEYVILTAFPMQHWSHESASMSRYTYTVLFFHVAILCRMCLWPVTAVGI